MKSIYKIIAVLMCAALLFGACSNGQTLPDDVTPTPTIPDTGLYIVKDGTTDYKIVVPQNAHARIVTAAEELRLFIGEASGAQLEIITDEVAVTATDKVISLGKTTVAQRLGVSTDGLDLGGKGFRIATKGHNVVITEQDDLGYGTLYGVYEFLHHTVGYEFYAADEIALEKADTVKLLNFDLTDKPDIEWRTANTGSVLTDSVATRRFRLESWREIWMYDYGDWHNHFKYLPPSVYNDPTKPDTYHPKWYSADGSQLSLLANGDEEELALMQQEVAGKMITMILNNPELENLTFTQEDYATWCDSDASVAARERYGTDAASQIWFLNALSDLIADYFEENQIERTVNLYFFAYHKTVEAPVTTDQDGNFIPIDQSVVCRDNVFVFYAPIDANRRASFLDPVNANFRQLLSKWKVLSKQIALWPYSATFGDFIQPFDAFSSMQENYRWYAENDVIYLFDQGQHSQPNETTFTKLKSYLNSKLAWDCDADIDTLTQNFFKHYYKDAGDEMLSLFQSLRTHWAYQYHHLDLKDNEQANAIKHYEYGTLVTWLGQIDNAYSEIASLQNSDHVLYKKLYDRINLESISLRYVLISLHASKFTDSQLYELKTQFVNDCTELNITMLKDGSKINLLWKAWGL